jgi:hypothetical protein
MRVLIERADVGFWGRSGNLVLDQSTTGFDLELTSSSQTQSTIPRQFVNDRPAECHKAVYCFAIMIGEALHAHSRDVRSMVAIGGKADMAATSADFRV